MEFMGFWVGRGRGGVMRRGDEKGWMMMGWMMMGMMMGIEVVY